MNITNINNMNNTDMNITDMNNTNITKIIYVYGMNYYDYVSISLLVLCVIIFMYTGCLNKMVYTSIQESKKKYNDKISLYDETEL